MVRFDLAKSEQRGQHPSGQAIEVTLCYAISLYVVVHSNVSSTMIKDAKGASRGFEGGFKGFKPSAWDLKPSAFEGFEGSFEGYKAF